MSKSKIEWTDRTWNPVSGCTKISPGCQNCYAERMSKRLAGRCGYPKDDPFKVTVHPERLDEPLRWKKPSRVFVCSMGDLFHPNVPDEFIFKVFNTMTNAQWSFGHKFMVLTKRPERMKMIIQAIEADLAEQRKPIKNPNGTTTHNLVFSFPLQNIWLGVTAENQEQADKRIPVLLQIPAAVRFVSVEPMLGPVDLLKNGDILCRCEGCMSMAKEHPGSPGLQRIDWIICGGESGHGARPMHPDWARNLRDQCQAAGVPFFFKQWGEWLPQKEWLRQETNPAKEREWVRVDGKRMFRVGKKIAGRLLDGRTWDEYPGAP